MKVFRIILVLFIGMPPILQAEELAVSTQAPQAEVAADQKIAENMEDQNTVPVPVVSPEMTGPMNTNEFLQDAPLEKTSEPAVETIDSTTAETSPTAVTTDETPEQQDVVYNIPEPKEPPVNPGSEIKPADNPSEMQPEETPQKPPIPPKPVDPWGIITQITIPTSFQTEVGSTQYFFLGIPIALVVTYQGALDGIVIYIPGGNITFHYSEDDPGTLISISITGPFGTQTFPIKPPPPPPPKPKPPTAYV